MSARWPYLTMPVGVWFVVEKPPTTFGQTVRRYGYENGKVFRVHQVVRGCPDWLQVRRVV